MERRNVVDGCRMPGKGESGAWPEIDEIFPERAINPIGPADFHLSHQMLDQQYRPDQTPEDGDNSDALRREECWRITVVPRFFADVHDARRPVISKKPRSTTAPTPIG